ncbi:hypothetical protein HDR58_01730 [bacterium]|nr:hypothetical protein [bacterium]
MNTENFTSDKYLEKEFKTQDILVNLNSYLEIASSYIANNDNNKELFHLGLLVDNMQDEVTELMKMYNISKPEV